MTSLASDEYLKRLYRMKRDCLVRLGDAESAGDSAMAGSCQLELRTILSMIQRKGGDPNV